MSVISQDEILSFLSYDPLTGDFTRRGSPRGRHREDGIAGSLYSCGYIYIYVQSKRYIAHRLVWLYVHGYMPVNDLDHINGVRSDNRIENLRECTRSENMQNYKLPSTNKSGFLGVHWRARENRWAAVINHQKVMHRLGTFATAAEARDAYLSAKKLLHTVTPVPR